jgi:hypothetical protein
MDFIRINMHRIKVSSVFGYCQTQVAETPEEILQLSPRDQANYEKIRHSLKVFVQVGPTKSFGDLVSFETEEELQAALSKLDSAFPKFFRDKEWRLDLNATIEIAESMDNDEPCGVAFLFPSTSIAIEARDPAQRAELFARIDSQIESL